MRLYQLCTTVDCHRLGCRLYFQHTGSGASRAHPELSSRADDNPAAGRDLQLGHCLTLTQLGQWQDAAASLAELNRFFKEQYDQAAGGRANALGGVPPDHVDGKGQLVLEEWIRCMKELNRRGAAALHLRTSLLLALRTCGHRRQLVMQNQPVSLQSWVRVAHQSAP